MIINYVCKKFQPSLLAQYHLCERQQHLLKSLVPVWKDGKETLNVTKNWLKQSTACTTGMFSKGSSRMLVVQYSRCAVYLQEYTCVMKQQNVF